MKSSSWPRRGVLVLLVAALAGACGDDGPPAPAIDATPDAHEDPWFTPTPGEAKNWDIQLAAPFDVSTARAMYILDLWDVTTAQTITYADSSTVSVPAGPLAGKIADIHAAGGVVICHVETGAIALDDPDAMKFPGFAANPPDDPMAPAAGSVIGWSIGGDANLRSLDIRVASQPMIQPLIDKRIELAKTIGCDGVTGEHNDRVGSTSGFTITGDDVVAWYKAIATATHARELSAGMWDGNLFTPGLVADYDWMLIERCAEFGDCDTSRSFTMADKAVFALDYDGGVTLDLACLKWPMAQIGDGLLKDRPPTASFRMSCP
ncbi:MAG TPA: endo alpha-1,4 polygalactosaminidase [Kofleriaceae bacterium]|nr:endo alpha-1,4 polygalactosaminidase [Kofleriaceae bacterium]